MRFLRAVLLCLPLLAGCGVHAASSPPLTRTVDGLTVQLTPSPNPPHVGHDTDFTVSVTHGGAPVTGAGVRLSLYYRTMSQEGPSEVCPESAPGQYVGHELSTGMNGQWDGNITVSRASLPDVHIRIPFTVQK